MEEVKAIPKKEYERIISRIGYYMKNKNIARIFKKKCPLFAAGGDYNVITLFSNSMEFMGNIRGHKGCIQCLCPISNIIIASGSQDMTIKIWNFEDRSIMSTLSGHISIVSALCYVKEGVLVSGSWDKSLIIWSKCRPESSSSYSLRQALTGHKSKIMGIIRVNNREIMSGESQGDLIMWDIDEGLCIRQIPRVSEPWDFIFQMKQHIGGDVVVMYKLKVRVWGAANNWGYPIKQIDNDYYGRSIGFLSGNLLLIGGEGGRLQFIDYQTGYQFPPIIMGIGLVYITAIQPIAKNIVVTAMDDGYLKVVDPISKICYIKCNVGYLLYALAYFY